MTKSDDKLILAILAFFHGLDHGLLMIFPTVLLLIKSEFSLSFYQIGILGTLQAFGFGFTSIPSGFFADKLGEIKTLYGFLTVCGISSLLIAFSPMSFYVLGVFYLLLGIGTGLYHPVSTALVSKLFESNRGFALGVHGIGGTLGLALAPTVSGILADKFGWRSAYFGFAFLSFLSVFVFHLIYKKTLERGEKPKVFFKDLKSILKIAILILLGIRTFEGLFYNSAITYTQTFIEKTLVIATLKGGFFTTLALLGGVLGQALGGFLADKFGRKKTILLFFALDFLFIFLIPRVPNFFLIFLIALFFFTLFASQPPVNALIADLTP
ncbi:MAG: MFS transporter, partial [Candidatus Methanofastidiosia archaeon]